MIKRLSFFLLFFLLFNNNAFGFSNPNINDYLNYKRCVNSPYIRKEIALQKILYIQEGLIKVLPKMKKIKPVFDMLDWGKITTYQISQALLKWLKAIHKLTIDVARENVYPIDNKTKQIIKVEIRNDYKPIFDLIEEQIKNLNKHKVSSHQLYSLLHTLSMLFDELANESALIKPLSDNSTQTLSYYNRVYFKNFKEKVDISVSKVFATFAKLLEERAIKYRNMNKTFHFSY